MYHSVYSPTIVGVYDMPTNSVKKADSGTLWINNGSSTEKPSGYLYFELATEITIKVDGNEAVTKVNDSLANYGLNYCTPIWTRSDDNRIISKVNCSANDLITFIFGFDMSQYSAIYSFYDKSDTIIGNAVSIHEKQKSIKAPTNSSYIRFLVFNGNGFESNISQSKYKFSVYINNAIDGLKNDLFDVKANMSHNIPRTIPKDITSYYNDGTIWKRLNGTDGFSKYEDIFVGDYFKMSRAISAYNQDQNYQLTGSDWVTIAGISTLLGNGDTGISYEHLVMVPGKGFGGTQHFGRSRMNPTHTTVGGYVGSEMHTTTIGEVVSSGSTATTATINQQLYAEFGSHLKTTRELLSNSLNSTGYNRFGEAGGCSNNWGWYDCQAVLMSEIELYGSIVWSSSGYDTGAAKMQLPLFAHNRQAMSNRSSWYWLKDVASASNFCNCGYHGFAYYNSAGNAFDYVRPRFVIAA